MSRNTDLYLNDIKKSCKKILSYVRDIEFEEFCKDQKTYDAVIRNLEIIGEASKNISDETRIKFSNIEWKKIAGLTRISHSLSDNLDNLSHHLRPQISSPCCKNNVLGYL